MPLEELDTHVDKFRGSTCLLFCRSGARSHIAKQKLARHGIDDVFNVGAYNRAIEVAQPSA